MNNVNLIGRLTKDIEVKTTNNGKDYCRFNLAVQRNKDETYFINCVAWNNTAQMMYNYLEKGRKIAVEGMLANNKYTDKSGNQRVDTYVLVNKVYFCDNPKKENNQATYGLSEPTIYENENDDDGYFPF